MELNGILVMHGLLELNHCKFYYRQREAQWNMFLNVCLAEKLQALSRAFDYRDSCPNKKK